MTVSATYAALCDSVIIGFQEKGKSMEIKSLSVDKTFENWEFISFVMNESIRKLYNI